jgi:hypothetical protein
MSMGKTNPVCAVALLRQNKDIGFFYFNLTHLLPPFDGLHGPGFDSTRMPFRRTLQIKLAF